MTNHSYINATTVASFISTISTIAAAASSSDIFLNNFIDFCITFIVPVICFFGMTTNVINYVVFSNRNLMDIVFRYYRANAVSNFLYLINCFFLFAARCGIYCNFSSTYAAQFYLYLPYTYIKGIFAIFSICIQILVTFYRFLIVTNRNTSPIKKHFWLIISVLLIFSAIFYSPVIFTKEIKEKITNKTNKVNGTVVGFTLTYSYSNVNNFIGNSDFGKWLIIFVVTISRSFIALGTLFTIDILTIYKLKKQNLRSKQIKSKVFNHIFITFYKSNSRKFWK